jgi:exonuclease SbcC
MAAELRRGLTPGEPCPVCAQAVATVPRTARAPKVAEAEKAFARARKEDEGARVAHTRAQTDAAAATARYEAAAAEVPRRAEAARSAAAKATTAAASLAATQSEVFDRLGEGDPHQLVEARRRELDESERAVTEAWQTEQEARAALDEARAHRTGVLDQLDTIRAAVLLAWGRLGGTVEVPAVAAGVRDGFVSLRERLTADIAGAGEAEDESRRTVADVADELRVELDGAGLAPNDDIEQAVGNAQGARTAAEVHVAGLEEILARGSDLEARLADALARRDLAKRLVADLQPSRFLDFLLAEERRALAAVGSVHLEELSDGAYRFTDDDTFDVVDVNAASTPRLAKSLSGGETFLASLALALALAEMVARDGSRLDSFFLDEGLGSLDPEHLDRAMDGIARLVAGNTDRLVVLVSHVEQMRQTLEDLIVLDKDPRTGDTIVVSGAAPAI